MISININGRKVELPEDQAQKLIEAYGVPQRTLADTVAGETVKIGKFEMVVLEQMDGQTALILKGMYGEDTVFGDGNNNYDGSTVDSICIDFGVELANIVGIENVVDHEVDLTSDDGLKDYGTIRRIASIITTDMYRKFVDILDTCNPKLWWWLATPHSTKRHENEDWVKCVSPSGYVYDSLFDNDNGVRPFCILESTIFVSE